MAGKQTCKWHWYLRQPIEVQVRGAEARLKKALSEGVNRPRVPKEEWPLGERWCSGCQSFIPLFYCTGSQCKACRSRANHQAHIEATYEITEAEYRRLLELQGGRCYICQRVPRSRRLAVDHDHETNEVRGLLCADSRRGCNHAVLGNIKDLAMAKRIVAYLEDPPMARMRRGEAVSVPRSHEEESGGCSTPPPF